MAARFEERDKHFVLKAAQGEVVGLSEQYSREENVSRGMRDFKVAALEAIADEIQDDPDLREHAPYLRDVAEHLRCNE